MIEYKFDILNAIKNKGFTTYRLRHEKILSESTIGKLRKNDTSITLANVDTICRLLNCQPGDLLSYISDEKNSSISDEEIGMNASGDSFGSSGSGESGNG